jgi:hypothetical protein
MPPRREPRRAGFKACRVLSTVQRVLQRGLDHFLFMKNVNSLLASECDSNSLPVCFENA